MPPTQHFLCEAPHTRTAIAGIKWLGGQYRPYGWRRSCQLAFCDRYSERWLPLE
jgi:hypothetical protein